MAKHARSDNAKIVRKLGDPASEKIGSRVFPLRGPPTPMPTVGTRRSTRVFVAKTPAKVAADADLAARVLRSGKRLVLSKPVEGKKSVADGGGADGNEWMRLFGDHGDVEDIQWWKGEKEISNTGKNSRHKVLEPDGGVVEEEFLKTVPEVSGISPSCEKVFGIVYSRKRRRSRSDGSASSSSQSGDKEAQDRRYGISFVRRPRRKKPKVAPLVEVVSRKPEMPDREVGLTDYARNFAEKTGILERKLWFGSLGRVVLIVLVEPSPTGRGLCGCSCFLLSLLSAMRKTRVNLFDFAAFCLSKSIASVFSSRGIHFLPVRYSSSDASYNNVAPDAGICVIYGVQLFVPLFSLNCAALPFFFKSLHSSTFLRSLYLPGVLARYQKQLCEATSMDGDVEVGRLRESPDLSKSSVSGMEIILFENPALRGGEVASVSKVLPFNEVAAVNESPASRSFPITHGGRFRKHQRKRSSLRSGRAPSSTLLRSRRNTLLNAPNSILKVGTAAKPCSLNFQEKPLDACFGDFLRSRRERALYSPASLSKKRRKSARKNLVERPEDLKSALDEAKQDIDSAQCKANILVIELDRCWREEGAEVMLESSGPNEWCLAIRIQGTVRYLHKPHEKSPSAINRYNHAMMWIGEDGWKLEFCDKKEWLVFKELHRECCERNAQDVSIKIIPVPGVQEVSGYEECFTTPFLRPESYIRTMNELERALTSETAGYDMDSLDEEWLQRLNLSLLNQDDDNSSHLSEDSFEKIIFAFEKAAYSHADVVGDSDKAVNLCLDLGKRTTVSAIFDYWTKKRKQKRSALIRVFQLQTPNKRTQIPQKPCLRKKRSFKRTGSHVGRGKPESSLEALAKQEAVRRVEEAEAAANRAVEVAVQMRIRAQLLMWNADLATYKSVMALRLADGIQVSEASDDAVRVLSDASEPPALDLTSCILG